MPPKAPGANDPAASELARLHRLVADKSGEVIQFQELQSQLQVQLREAVGRADAAESASAASARRCVELEHDVGEASDAVEDLARQLESRDAAVTRLEAQLAQAQRNAEEASAQATEVHGNTRAQSAALVQAEARAAAAELRGDKLFAAAEAAAGERARVDARAQDAISECESLRSRCRELEVQLSSALSSLSGLEGGAVGSRRARAEGAAAQQVEYLNEQLAVKERLLVARDRQLSALKAARGELQATVDAAAGPGGYSKLAGALEADAAESVALAQKAAAAARRERDCLAVALEAVSGAAAVHATLRDARCAAGGENSVSSSVTTASGGATKGGGAAAGAPQHSVVERLALERADEALAACEVLRRERAELRRRVEELGALADPRLPQQLQGADARATAAQRRADVAERQLAAVKAEREQLRQRLDAAELGSASAGPLPASSDGADPNNQPLRQELAAVQVQVADVIERLRDREMVLAKVLARTRAA